MRDRLTAALERRRKPHAPAAAAAANKQFDRLRARCRDEAFHAYATSYIFQRRARRLKKRVQWITYLGFAVPMFVGLLVLAYTHLKSLPVIAGTASAVGIFQVIISLWAIVGGWVDGASYAAASAPANEVLADRYLALATNPPADTVEFRHEVELIRVQDHARKEQDLQQSVKDSEKRRGMRAALRKYQKPCVGCNKIPTDMTATSCGVCGNFKNWLM